MASTMKMKGVVKLLTLCLASLCLAACAADIWRSTEVSDPVALYGRAYSSGLFGYSCHPSWSPGSPEGPRYERVRRANEQRQRKVRNRLIEEFGAERLEAIEREAEEQESSVSLYRSCDPDATDRARRTYATLLRRLEARAAAPAAR